MSLDKGIKSGKEHRKPFHGSKSFDRTCRNHGACGWCASNRLKKDKGLKDDAKDQMKEA